MLKFRAQDIHYNLFFVINYVFTDQTPRRKKGLLGRLVGFFQKVFKTYSMVIVMIVKMILLYSNRLCRLKSAL